MTTTAEPDSEVISASLGQPQRFTAIYDKYSHDIFRYVRRRVGPDLADDVVAETFLAAFSQRGRYDPTRQGVRPWLYGIATHKVADHRRAERARYRALSRVPAERPTDGLAQQVADRTSAQSAPLAAALNRVKPTDRDVLLLVAWAGLSPTEAAQALGIPPGTARSRLARARRITRAALEAAHINFDYEEYR